MLIMDHQPLCWAKPIYSLIGLRYTFQFPPFLTRSVLQIGCRLRKFEKFVNQAIWDTPKVWEKGKFQSNSIQKGKRRGREGG